MFYADIHSHSLYGVDDGAKTQEDMQAMLDAAYADGSRDLCFTPHFHLGYFGDNIRERDTAFSEAKEYAKIKFPDMRLYLGNELRYSRECISWLEDGLCLTLNGTRCVLVDFSETERAGTIADGINRLLNAGYTPVLAHAERYELLSPGLREVQSFRQKGVLIQLDSQSLLGDFGPGVKRRAKAMLRRGYVDFISTDAHSLRHRPPEMNGAFQFIERKYGRICGESLCRDNALKLLRPDEARKDTNGNNEA